MDNANPELARKVAKARVAQSEAGFLTYCAMCRDQLAKTGKPVLHILDLLFPDTAHEASEAPAGIFGQTREPTQAQERAPRSPWP